MSWREGSQDIGRVDAETLSTRQIGKRLREKPDVHCVAVSRLRYPRLLMKLARRTGVRKSPYSRSSPRVGQPHGSLPTDNATRPQLIFSRQLSANSHHWSPTNGWMPVLDPLKFRSSATVLS